MVRANHRVGDDAREQRLDGGQDGDGDAVGKLFAQQIDRELRHVQLGQAGVDGVQIADGAHVHAEQGYHDHAHDDGDKRAGHLGSQRAQSRPQKQHRQAYRTYHERLPIEGAEVRGECRYFVERFDCRRPCGVCEPEEVFQLADYDGHRDARRETGGDGVGHEADDGAQLEQAHEHKQHAGDQRRRHQPVDAVGRDDAGHDGCEGGGGAGDLHARAAEEGDQESCDNCGVEPLLGTDARCDCQRDGERQRHDGDYDARHDVAGKLLFELFFGGMLDDAEQDRFDFVALQGCLIPPRCFVICRPRCPPGCFRAAFRVAQDSPGRFRAHCPIPYWGQKNSTQAIPGGI